MTRIGSFLKLIDIEHTLFGLPFTYLGAILAAGGIPTAIQLWWITLAMIAARTAALCLNRLIDLEIDRVNPRTANWILPAGKLQVKWVWLIVLFALTLLLVSAARLNPLCLKLAPLAVIVLWGYSYTKRFTWWCHFILGLAIGMGPVGAWIAITGTFDWQPLFLGLAVACWIAGFDAMYACQDIDFDRTHNLHSMPARFGNSGALRCSSAFHFIMVLALLINALIMKLGLWYYSGVVVSAVILIYEHSIVKPDNLEKVNFASFKINRYVGLIIFTATLLDILL